MTKLIWKGKKIVVFKIPRLHGNHLFDYERKSHYIVLKIKDINKRTQNPLYSGNVKEDAIKFAKIFDKH